MPISLTNWHLGVLRAFSPSATYLPLVMALLFRLLYCIVCECPSLFFVYCRPILLGVFFVLCASRKRSGVLLPAFVCCPTWHADFIAPSIPPAFDARIGSADFLCLLCRDVIPTTTPGSHKKRRYVLQACLLFLNADCCVLDRFRGSNTDAWWAG